MSKLYVEVSVRTFHKGDEAAITPVVINLRPFDTLGDLDIGKMVEAGLKSLAGIPVTNLRPMDREEVTELRIEESARLDMSGLIGSGETDMRDGSYKPHNDAAAEFLRQKSALRVAEPSLKKLIDLIFSDLKSEPVIKDGALGKDAFSPPKTSGEDRTPPTAKQEEAQLGLATTAELLAELQARAELGGHANYRTVGPHPTDEERN